MKKRYKIPLSVLMVFMLAVAVTILIVIKTDFLENRANEFLRMAVERKYDLKISIGDIGGSLLYGVNVSDIIVRYEGAEEDYTVASIAYIEAEYNLWDIVRQRWDIEGLVIDSLDVRIRRGPGGGLVLPEFGGDGGTNGGGLPEFRIDGFTLTAGSFRLTGGDDSIYVDSIGLLGDVTSSEGIIQAELKTLIGVSKSHNISLNGLSGLITVADSVIMAEEMRAVVDSSVFVFESEINTRPDFGVTAEFDTAQIDVARVAEIAGLNLRGDVGFDGEVGYRAGVVETDIVVTGDFLDWYFDEVRAIATIDGRNVRFDRLSGGVFGGRIDGSGSIDFATKPEEYRFSGRINGLDINSAVEGTFESSLSGRIELEGKSFRGEEIVLDITTDLGSSSFDAYSFDSLSGAMVVTQDSARFIDPMRLTYKSTTVRAGGLLEYEGKVDISGEADLPRIGEFRNQIFLQDIGGRGTATFRLTGPTEDPNLSGSFSSDSVQIYDFTSDDFLAFLEISNFFSNPNGDVEIYSDAYRYSGLSGQSLFSYLVVNPDSVRIPEFETRIGSIDMQARGLLRVGEDTMQVELFSADAYVDTQLIEIDSSALITILDSSVQLDSVTVKSNGGLLGLAGSYNFDESVDFRFNADSMSISQWLPYVYGESYLGGYFFANGQVAGNLQEPTIEVALETRSLVYSDQPMGQLKGRLAYSDRKLLFEDFSITGDSNQTRASGVLPIDLAFGSREERILRDDSLRFDIAVTGTSFDLAVLFFEDIEWFNGRFNVDVSGFGTFNDMRFRGNAKIDSGEVKVYQLANPIQELRVDADFEQREIRINELIGTMSHGKKSGKLWVDGNVNLQDLSKPAYDLVVHGDDLPIVYDLGLIEATVDTMTIYIEGSDPPFAEGDIDLTRFWYGEPFYTNVKGEALAAADTGQGFSYRIEIRIPQNMWIENDEADLELGGDLIIIKQGRDESFLGKLETIRGKINLTQLNRTFTVVPGGEIMFNNVEEFNPTVNIQLTTTIRDSVGVRDVCMQITRTLENPRIDVCPDSDVSIEEALTFLNPLQGALGQPAASDTAAASPSLAGRLSVGAAGIAINQAARYFAQSLGVETLEINPSLTGDKVGADLTVGFYYNPKLYIYGSSQTSAQFLELGFDYRISKHVFLSGQRDRDNLYHLNLNLNWEFE